MFFTGWTVKKSGFSPDLDFWIFCNCHHQHKVPPLPDIIPCHLEPGYVCWHLTLAARAGHTNCGGLCAQSHQPCEHAQILPVANKMLLSLPVSAGARSQLLLPLDVSPFSAAALRIWGSCCTRSTAENQTLSAFLIPVLGLALDLVMLMQFCLESGTRDVGAYCRKIN